MEDFSKERLIHEMIQGPHFLEETSERGPKEIRGNSLKKRYDFWFITPEESLNLDIELMILCQGHWGIFFTDSKKGER